MKRAIVPMSAGLKAKAEKRAKREGVSLGHFVRNLVEAQFTPAKVKRREPSEDPFLNDTFVDKGSGPTDVARNHDQYLAQIMDEKLERNGHVKAKTRRRVRR